MTRQRTKNLYEGLASMKKPELLPFDDYFLTMADSDQALGRADIHAVKTYHIRKNPFGGHYALLGGITSALLQIERTRLDNPLFIRRLRELGHSEALIKRLRRQKKLCVRIYAPEEGAMFFPNEPIVTAEGPLADIRLIEGILTRELNFASLSLTKWHRLVRAAAPQNLLDFGRRRAQNSDESTLYAMLAGCSHTSNDNITEAFDFPVAGTMGHEWIQSIGDVRKAFQLWLDINPARPLALVDTVSTLDVDYPAWLDVVYENRARILRSGANLWGWRNDSGDLADITVKQYLKLTRHQLYAEGWFKDNMRIILTGDLDEYAMPEIVQNITKMATRHGIDPGDITKRLTWGAGTRPATCYDQPSIGGVMKITEMNGSPSMKLALNGNATGGAKTSIPGFNMSASILDKSGNLTAILVYPAKKTARYPYASRLSTYDINDNRHNLDLRGKTILTKQKPIYDSIDRQGRTFQRGNPDITKIPHIIREQTDTLEGNHLPIKVLFTSDIHHTKQTMIKNRTIIQR